MPFLPGQVEQGLFGVMTRIGAAFIEDQIVLLKSQSREGMRMELELWGPEEAEKRAFCLPSLGSSPDPVGFNGCWFYMELWADCNNAMTTT